MIQILVKPINQCCSDCIVPLKLYLTCIFPALKINGGAKFSQVGWRRFHFPGFVYIGWELLVVLLTMALFRSSQLHYYRLPKDISEDHVILMDATVATGAAGVCIFWLHAIKFIDTFSVGYITAILWAFVEFSLPSQYFYLHISALMAIRVLLVSVRTIIAVTACNDLKVSFGYDSVR